MFPCEFCEILRTALLRNVFKERVAERVLLITLLLFDYAHN